MTKLSHFCFVSLLTACGAVSAAPGGNPTVSLPAAGKLLTEVPVSFDLLVARKAKKAGISHSFAPAAEKRNTRTQRFLPVEAGKWKDARGEVADQVTGVLEMLENRLGPIVIHQLEVKSVTLVDERNQGETREYRVVVLNWSPAWKF